MGPLYVVAKLWEEHTGTDDTEVGREEHSAQRNVTPVFIHAGSNDIRTACRTVVRENGGQCNAGDDTAYDHRYEILSFAHQFEGQSVGLLWQDVLCELQHEGQHQDGIDSLHQELEAQDFQCYDK